MDHFLGTMDEQMQCRGILHIVESGDTLYKIGKKYGVPVSRIMYANPYVNVYNLQIGDEICVPVLVPRMPARESQTQEPLNRAKRKAESSLEDYLNGNTEPVRDSDARRYMMPAQEPGSSASASVSVAPMEQLQQGCMGGPACTGQMGFTGSFGEQNEGNAAYADDRAYMGKADRMKQSDREETFGEADSAVMQDTMKDADQGGMQEAVSEQSRPFSPHPASA